MQRNYNDVLLELLTIIRYPNDKQTYISEFEKSNFDEALANILERLPTEAQQAIMAKDGALDEIEKYIDKDAYNAEVVKVSHAALIRFVEVISPLLHLEQKEKVVQLLAEQNAT